MDARRKRAFIWATGALAICLIPLAGRVWLEKNGAMEHPDLGVVGEFVVRDQADVPMTRDQLRRSVTVLIYWPAACLNTSDCKEARQAAGLVHDWVNASLKPKWTEENNPLILGVVGDGVGGLGAFADWRQFALKPEDGTLLPAGTDLTKPWLVVVDNSLQFAAKEDLSLTVDFKMLERVLSKTAFDQYLGNYLSSRTFMGPKRTQK